jgi:hypothetical protein
MPERRPSNSELRLRRLTEEEPDPAPRGILEIFSEADESDDADAALTRETDDE